MEETQGFILSQGCGWFLLPKGAFSPVQWLLRFYGLPENTSLAEQLDSYLNKMSAPGSKCRIVCLQGVATSLEGGQGIGDHIHFELERL